MNEVTELRHSWLNVDRQDEDARLSKTSLSCKENPEVIATYMSQLSSSRQLMLTTCHVQIISRDGHTTQARALLNLASST